MLLEEHFICFLFSFLFFKKKSCPPPLCPVLRFSHPCEKIDGEKLILRPFPPEKKNKLLPETDQLKKH